MRRLKPSEGPSPRRTLRPQRVGEVVDDSPNAILLITQNLTPPGLPAVFHDDSLSVAYSLAAKKWQIYHNKGPTDPILVNESFNVVVIP